MFMHRLEGHGGRDLTLTSAEGHDLSKQSLFGFRVCDNERSNIGVVRQQRVGASVQLNDPAIRQTATQGRYQRLQTV